jgi:hypothetical protein
MRVEEIWKENVMRDRRLSTFRLTAGAIAVAGAFTALATVEAAQPRFPWMTWSKVANSSDPMPGAPGGRTFNSFNQPSVNMDGLVVFRARSRGGPPLGPPTHGIYIRDMFHGDVPTSPIERILDRTTEVPQPNNLLVPPGGPGLTAFGETPSFPRIDMWSGTIATRGNHRPVWRYVLPDGSETRAGTTGIYTNPFGDLVTGAAKLGAVPDFDFLAVPGVEPPTMFDVFPGAPAIVDGATIVFKGNYTVSGPTFAAFNATVGKTGVYYRDLEDDPIFLDDGTELSPAGGMEPVVLIADSAHTLIPGTTRVFGSTAPPSAADGQAVFAGFDDEESPTLGGIYLAPLAPYDPLTEQPDLKTLVGIGQRVPGEGARMTFRHLGEGMAFDGRYVAFWGAWGSATRTVRLYCPVEGNRDRLDYCNRRLVCADTDEALGDPDSICDDVTDPHYPRCYQDKPVPVRQGIFVHDTAAGGRTRTVAKTGARFDEFLFWNYSGKAPCVGSGHGEEGGDEDGEPARWRSSAYVAVSGFGKGKAAFTAFKAARRGDVGIYLGQQPGRVIIPLLDTTMDGQALDPEAPAASTIIELGLEREGLRGDWLAISAKMGIEGGTEEEGTAGIYITQLPLR